MKNAIKISMVGLLACSLALVSCRKQPAPTPDDNTEITVDDAADAVTYAVEGGSGGYTDQVTDVAATSKSASLKTDGVLAIEGLTCGKAFDTTVTKAFNNGSATANYTFQKHYLLDCSGSTSNSLLYSGTYTGDFSGVRMTSTNSGKRNWTITDKNGVSYAYNGSFTRTGSCTSKVRNKQTFNTDLTITTTDLAVSKSTYKIVSGTCNVSVTCKASNGNSYSFTGTITYNNNNTATLKLNNNSYTINL